MGMGMGMGMVMVMIPAADNANTPSNVVRAPERIESPTPDMASMTCQVVSDKLHVVLEAISALFTLSMRVPNEAENT